MRKFFGLLGAVAMVAALVLPSLVAPVIPTADIALANHHQGTTTTTTLPPAGELYSGLTWSASNPPKLRVDSSFTQGGRDAIYAGTCGIDAVLYDNEQPPIAINRINHVAPDDLLGQLPAPSGLEGWDRLQVATNVPSGEIWFVPYESLKPGNAWFISDLLPETTRVKGLIVVDITNLPTASLVQSYDAQLGEDALCGSDLKIGKDKTSLQTTITHELMHAFGDFYDVYSDPGHNPDDEQYWPTAGCYGEVGGNTTQVGFTSCYKSYFADGNDTALRNLLEPEEADVIRSLYHVVAIDTMAVGEPIGKTNFESNLEHFQEFTLPAGEVVTEIELDMSITPNTIPWPENEYIWIEIVSYATNPVYGEPDPDEGTVLASSDVVWLDSIPQFATEYDLDVPFDNINWTSDGNKVFFVLRAASDHEVGVTSHPWLNRSYGDLEWPECGVCDKYLGHGNGRETSGGGAWDYFPEGDLGFRLYRNPG